MYRVGIDLGGTNIKAGITDKNNAILAQANIPTDLRKSEYEIIGEMSELAKRLARESGVSREKIDGIGVGSPGVIDNAAGIVKYSNNFGWENVPLAALLSSFTSAPVFVANDAECAALGEAAAGAGQRCGNLILLTLGTGIGGGIIVDGKLFRGKCGGGVVGHTVIVKGGRQCTCGRRGCLETYASASALIRETNRVIQEKPDSLLAVKYGRAGLPVTGKTAFDAAAAGDVDAKKIVGDYIEYLGEGIANLINVFRPEKFLISGGVCNQGDSLFDPLNVFVRKNCFAADKLYIPLIERAMLGNSAGIIGAALLVPENEGRPCARAGAERKSG